MTQIECNSNGVRFENEIIFSVLYTLSDYRTHLSIHSHKGIWQFAINKCDFSEFKSNCASIIPSSRAFEWFNGSKITLNNIIIDFPPENFRKIFAFVIISTFVLIAWHLTTNQRLSQRPSRVSLFLFWISKIRNSWDWLGSWLPSKTSY